jgi:hypothetical protein
MPFALTRFIGIGGKPGVCSRIPSPMRSEHTIINIESASFSGCVCPITIPRGGDNRLFPKIRFKGFFIEDRCEYGFDSIESVQSSGFKNKTKDSCEIKPIRLGSTVTVVLVHSNMEICKGINGYQIW